MSWRWAFIMLILTACAGFVALGNWQLERLSWKRELIERVEARVSAPVVAAPAPDEWLHISRQSHEYRHITLRGQFLQNKDTLVVAATEKGSGYWVLTPLLSVARGTVLINRGFIGQGVAPQPPPAGHVTLSGLLRLPEPDGAFLRDNNPDANRWYSRDVSAIGKLHQLDLAPYFIDADVGQPGSPGVNSTDSHGPIGGLTVIHFNNTHRVYALTWYTLALMALGAAISLFRERRTAR